MINNEFYNELGERWYTAEGDAVALLRQENETKAPWVMERIREFHKFPKVRVLDVGCGGGFLTLEMAKHGFECTGLDVSHDVLAPGRRRDVEGQVDWIVGQAEGLPFANGTFDVVCSMDVLEHLKDPQKAISEAVRVLKPNGTLLLHTFNRTLRSWIFAAKGLDLFIKNSQSHVHDWKMFIRPEEVKTWLTQDLDFTNVQFTGIEPCLNTKAFFRLLMTRRVPKDFRFKLGNDLAVGYLVCARR